MSQALCCLLACIGAFAAPEQYFFPFLALTHDGDQTIRSRSKFDRHCTNFAMKEWERHGGADAETFARVVKPLCRRGVEDAACKQWLTNLWVEAAAVPSHAGGDSYAHWCQQIWDAYPRIAPPAVPDSQSMSQVAGNVVAKKSEERKVLLKRSASQVAGEIAAKKSEENNMQVKKITAAQARSKEHMVTHLPFKPQVLTSTSSTTTSIRWLRIKLTKGFGQAVDPANTSTNDDTSTTTTTTSAAATTTTTLVQARKPVAKLAAGDVSAEGAITKWMKLDFGDNYDRNGVDTDHQEERYHLAHRYHKRRHNRHEQKARLATTSTATSTTTTTTMKTTASIRRSTTKTSATTTSTTTTINFSTTTLAQAQKPVPKLASGEAAAESALDNLVDLGLGDSDAAKELRARLLRLQHGQVGKEKAALANLIHFGLGNSDAAEELRARIAAKVSEPLL